MHSTHNQKGLPRMSHWQTTIGSPNTAEKYRRPNRGTRRYKTDLIISKQCRRSGRLVSNS